MVRMTFVGARRVGLFVWLTLLVSGCASILGNDYEMEQGDAAVGTGASGSRTATSTGGAGGTGGSQAASGAAGSVAGGASGAGGSQVTAGASGAGGAITGGASGATGTGGSAGLDPDAGDSNVTPPDSSVADAPSDRSQGGDAVDVARIDASDAGSAGDAPVCNPLNGSCGGGGLTCNAGFASCNGNVSDGCECATSGCCGASCQIQHVACMLNGNPATPCIDGTGIHFTIAFPKERSTAPGDQGVHRGDRSEFVYYLYVHRVDEPAGPLRLRRCRQLRVLGVHRPEAGARFQEHHPDLLLPSSASSPAPPP